jgi:hypothetical protein
MGVLLVFVGGGWIRASGIASKGDGLVSGGDSVVAVLELYRQVVRFGEDFNVCECFFEGIERERRVEGRVLFTSIL